MERSSLAALLAIGGLGGVPWIVFLDAPGQITLVMGWGLVNTNPWHVLGLPAYLDATQGLATLPRSLQLWPVSFGIYCAGAASALGGVVFDREDTRVTAGLLLLAALGSTIVWWRFAASGLGGAIPVGGFAIAVVAWWFYRPALDRFVDPR